MGADARRRLQIRELESDPNSRKWSLTPIHPQFTRNNHYLFANRSKYAFRNLATFGAITIWQYG